MKSRRNKNSHKTIIWFLVIPIMVFGLIIAVIKKFDINIRIFQTELINPVASASKEERIQKLLSSSGLSVKSLSLGNNITVTYSGDLTVIFSDEENVKSSVASLQFIVSRSKIEGKIPKIIDFRFNKPVVIY